MIKCAFYLAPDGELLDQLNIEQISDFQATREGLLWVEMEDVKKRGQAVEKITWPLLALQHLYPLS